MIRLLDLFSFLHYSDSILRCRQYNYCNKRRVLVKVDIVGNELVITLPLRTPELSKSGKTLIVATSSGLVSTSAMVDGKAVTVGVNAFIAK